LRLAGVPSSAFRSILGLFAFGEISDGRLAFLGFILRGMFGELFPPC
tara:strand:- start:174 stop:314 length:141 start_codon:yes stop_codon:yes gene_type:complete